LYIAGSNLGRGYHRGEELTARKFIPNPFVEGQFMYRTGDLARWLSDGNIEFIGRADYQVKIRGFRIELGEIETRLMEIDFIKEAVIVDYKDPDGEKYLCAYFVSQKEVEISDIKDILASDLPDYMVPLYFVPLEKIPLTSNGKVDKKELPLPEFKTNEIHVGPRNDVEMKLLSIWSEVLGINKGTIGIDANFFEWGGHSLKATILITWIHQLFDVKISLGEMFDQPTIRGLAVLIKESAADTFSPIEPVEKKEYYPLFSAQKRLYILQQMDPDSIAYNLPRVVTLEGEVEPGRLEKAFQELTNRHESLRTSFHLIQNIPMQKTHQEVSVPVAYWEMEAEAAREKVRAFIAPFDLKKAPLLRVGLIKTGAHSHILFAYRLPARPGAELRRKLCQFPDRKRKSSRLKDPGIEVRCHPIYGTAGIILYTPGQNHQPGRYHYRYPGGRTSARGPGKNNRDVCQYPGPEKFSLRCQNFLSLIN
jgi:acyl carrier protein